MSVPRVVLAMDEARYARWRRTAWRRFAKRLRPPAKWRHAVRRLLARWWAATFWLFLAASRGARLVSGRLQ